MIKEPGLGLKVGIHMGAKAAAILSMQLDLKPGSFSVAHHTIYAQSPQQHPIEPLCHWQPVLVQTWM
jgi:hypothetical protein